MLVGKITSQNMLKFPLNLKDPEFRHDMSEFDKEIERVMRSWGVTAIDVKIMETEE